jgi:hypothetical protein
MGALIMTVTRRWSLVFLTFLTLNLYTTQAQVARFESYGIESVPDNANVRIGPFFSDLSFFQSAGIRYTRSSGAGMDYLYNGHAPGVTPTAGQPTRYGQMKKDGVDLPLISQLTARNYFLISKYLAVDISFSLTYRAFPLGSEDNTFDVEIIDPGFYAHMGSFTFGATKDSWLGSFNGRNAQAYTGKESSGFSANLSADFELTPYIRGRVYERPSYRVDYVDARGYADNLSGQRYPVFQNLAGVDLDWQMAPNKNLGYTFSRTDTIPQDNSYDISRSVIYHQMLDYRQRISPLTTVGARADYYWRDYLETRGSQFQQDYLGYLNTDLTEDTTMNMSLGYSLAELTSATTSSYETNGTSESIIGGIGLQTRLTETLSHGMSYHRYQRAGFIAGYEITDSVKYNIQYANAESWSIGFSSAYETVTPKLANAAAYSDWANQISASRPLTRRLVLTLASAYVMRMNDTPAEGQIGDGELYLSNDYDTWASTAGLIQTLTDRLKLYTYVEHLERLSSNELLTGTRDTIGMTLGYYYDF